MTDLRPRHLVWPGRVLADGLWLDVATLGQAEARRRVLALWTPGCRLHELERGWLLRLPHARALPRPHPGQPLVERDGAWVGVPLTDREQARLEPEPGAVWLPRAGELIAQRPGAVLDPSVWLDPGPLELAPVLRLGPVEDDPTAVIEAPRPERSEPALDRQGVIEALRRDATRMSAPASLEAQLPAWARLLARLLGAVDRGLERLQPAPPKRPLRPGVPRAPRPPTWIDALRKRLADGLMSLAARGPLSWMARREAEWLRELLAAFDRGDLDEALRRAVPLVMGPGDGPALQPPPRREGALVASSTLGRSTAALLLSGTDLHGTLRALYERAHAQLLEEGRAQEAAFVLADLLDRPADAVRVLVEAGHLAQAAALAEGRELDPAWVVSLWVQADDLERAIRLARRHGVWAEALALVADEAPWAEAELRWAWASTRHAAGDVGESLRIAMAEPGLRDRADAWIDEALQQPAPSVVALAWGWQRRPASATLGAIEAVLRAEGTRGERARLELAHTLLQAGWPTARDGGEGAMDQRLARALARSLLASSLSTEALRRTLDPLLRAAADAALEQDRPHDAPRLTGSARTQWSADDRGDLPIFDVAWLPDGRLALALGRAGVRLLDPDGRRVGHIRAPAHHLVPSDTGTRLITVFAPDEDATEREVHRVDLERGTVQRWATSRLHAWARSFDGERWCVSTGSDLLVMDVLAEGWRHLGRVPVPGRLHDLVREPGSLRGIVGAPRDGFELWRWELPTLTLRARVPAVSETDAAAGVSVPRWLGTEAVALQGDTWATVGLSPRPVLSSARPSVGGPDSTKITALVHGGRELVAIPHPDGVHLDHGLGGQVTRLELHGARSVVLRMQGPVWLVADDQGRVLGLGEHGRVVLDVRVRA